jgi:hypothetical protein
MEFGSKWPEGSTTVALYEGHPARLHYVVGRDGDEGLDVLRASSGRMEAKDEVVPVFSAVWAARGYLFSEAPGGGWYVKACTPSGLASLLDRRCAGAEWVALDPRPGPRNGGEAATFMPRESFMDYLLAFSGEPFPHAGAQAASRGTPAGNTLGAAGIRPAAAIVPTATSRWR